MKKVQLSFIRRSGFGLAVAAAPLAAFAQSAPTLTGVAESAGNQFLQFLTTTAPALITILLISLGFRWILKMLKRGLS